MTKVLIPIVLEYRRGQPINWTIQCERDSVQFAFKLTNKGRKVPAKYRDSIITATKALETGDAPSALESDGEHASDVE